MAMAVVTLILMSLVIFSGMSLGYSNLNRSDVTAQALKQMASRNAEIARTQFNVVDASSEPWADMLRLRLQNSGQVGLTRFNKWDIIIGYDDDGGMHHETLVPFTDPPMDVNEWQKVGIYVDRHTEVFGPGILDPGEEIVIGARLSPAPGPNSTVRVTMSTPNGVRNSASFQAGPGHAVLTPHSDNWTLGSSSYYQLKDGNLADGAGTTMITDAIGPGQTGRWLLHNQSDASRYSQYIFSLAGIQQIPAATWKAYYRARTTGSWNPGTASISINSIIRKWDGTVRQTIASEVAQAFITDFSQWQTITTDYYFPGYTVIADTDYLEIDVYADSSSGGPTDTGYISLDVDNISFSYVAGTVVDNMEPTSGEWIQTSQADFEAGVLNQVNTTFSPGNVILATESSGWYDQAWHQRKSITIDHTKVSADLTDFPVLVSLTSDADLASDALDSGYDILFTSSDSATKLNHEIEQFDGATGKLVAWVKVPSLSSSSDTVIYIYYGNPSSGNQQNPTGVWDSNYKAVWHFGETAGGSGAIKDSTSNANNGTDTNSPTLGATGKVGKAVSFDGTNDYVSVSDSSSLDLSGDFTAQLWFSPTQAFGATADSLQGLLDKGGYKLFLDKSDGKLKAEVTDGSTSWASSYDGTQEVIYSLAVYNGKLYAGMGNGTGDGDVLVFDGSTWSTSYDGTQEVIYALAVYNGKLYAGQGLDQTDGDVLVFDGSTWSTSYDGTQDAIRAFAVYNGKLYAGQGNKNNDSDVLVFDGSTWSTSYSGTENNINALAVYNGKLYAGQGSGANDGDVLVFDGSTWSTSYNGSQETISSLAVYNGKLYAGQGSGANDGDVLVFDGSTWTTSYDGAQESISSLAVYNGKLYAGMGSGSGDGDVLVFDGTSWTTSYNGSQEAIYALAVYNGKLYSGQGDGTGDGDVYVLNAGSEVKSTTTSWSTSFHLVTATKSGTTLTLYVDGAQQASVTVSGTVETNALNLLIGKVFGSRGTGAGEGLFNGIIDESRISNSARSSQWITTEYNNQNSTSTFHSLGAEEGNYVPSGTIASQVYDSISSGATWDSLYWIETLPASTDITFEIRTSNSLFLKDAATPSWISVGGTSPVISGLPDGRYKQWRATLATTDSANTPTLSEVTVYYYR